MEENAKKTKEFKEIDLAAQLRIDLHKGPTNFAYRKKSGELRIAKGTLRLEDIPDESQPLGTGTPKANACAYYDLNVGAWRSYNPLCVVWLDKVGHDSLSREEYDEIIKYVMEQL
jgi:hypothetical protein